jgi:conjugal transfer ATP-binding protein TraC
MVSRRASTKTAYNAANMAPIIGEWPGTPAREGDRDPTPLLTLIGRRGQLMTIDPYANPAGNPNIVICGASGSGKSFLANELICRVLATGGRTWVLDVGFSYKNLADTLGGQYLEFDEKSDLCINPFDFVTDITHDMEVIKPIIAQMASHEKKLDAYELSQLEIHIQSVYLDKKAEGEIPTITDLAQSLINNCYKGGPNPRANDKEWREEVARMTEDQRNAICDPRIRDLGVQLFPFTADGTYGRFFNRRTNVRFTSNFIVLELEQLKANPHLQAVVLMLLMQLISHEVYLGDPAVKKLVLLDEAWQLLRAGDSADFIEGMYRRIRKAGGACATATQSIGDYSTPAARAALENADCVFLLRQKKDSIDALVRSGKYSMDENELKLLRTVTKVTGQFSEVYVKIGDFPGTVGRLIVDPYSELVYSTSPYDKTAIKQYRDQGLSLADSIQSVLRDRGKGGQALRMEEEIEENA